MRWAILVAIELALLIAPMSGWVWADTAAGNGGGSALLNHKLVGITYGDPRDTGAVFEDPRTKTQKVYRIGDRIEDATIIQIERRKVLLNRGGKTTVIYLSQGSPESGKTKREVRMEEIRDTVKDTFPIPVADPPDARLQALAMVIGPGDPRVEDKDLPITRDDLNHFAEEIQAAGNPGQIFVNTPLGPALSLERIDSNVLATMGLESSDRMVGISGGGIDSWDQLNKLLGILNNASVMNITVLRGSAVKPIYYSIKQH